MQDNTQLSYTHSKMEMARLISWKDINDGALGFEHLATRYVEEKFKFPNGNWQPTKETRDGNKDAYTVIIGFHPGVDKEETWWMEAKYSTAEKRKYLTRFRLDATIKYGSPKLNAQGSKLWHLATFQYQYLTILRTRDFSKLSNLETLVDSAQNNYYSNYRHRNLALCALFYYVGDIAKADERFLKDMANPRRLRERLKGFYYETLALHNLLHGNHQDALAALDHASITFKEVPSYLLPVQHNCKVLKRNKFSPKRIDFFKGGKLLSDWYYIDPRVD